MKCLTKSLLAEIWSYRRLLKRNVHLEMRNLKQTELQRLKNRLKKGWLDFTNIQFLPGTLGHADVDI